MAGVADGSHNGPVSTPQDPGTAAADAVLATAEEEALYARLKRAHGERDDPEAVVTAPLSVADIVLDGGGR